MACFTARATPASARFMAALASSTVQLCTRRSVMLAAGDSPASISNSTQPRL